MPRLDDRQPRTLAAVAVALVALLLGANTPYFERLMNANERPRLLQGMALVDAGEWAIDGPAARGIAPGIDLATGADGRLYPNKPPGASLPAAASWWWLRSSEPTLRTYTMAARGLGGWLPAVLLLAFMLARARSTAPADGSAGMAGGSAGAAGGSASPSRREELPAWIAAVVLLGLATPLNAQAHLLFGHSLAACLLFVGVALLVEPGSLASPLRMFGGGLLAGSAVAVEYTAVFVGAAVAVDLALRVRRRPLACLAALAGALLPILALAAYHRRVFGSPWSTGYHHATRDEFAQIHAEGLLGLHLPSAHTLFEHLLSPWGGLLVWSPLVVFAIYGLIARARANREDRRRSLVYLASFSVLLVVNLGLEQGGGWRVGPRYLVLALPFLALGWVEALQRLRARRVALVAFVTLATWSTLVNTAAANLFPHLIPVGNPLGDQLMPLLLAGREPWGWPPPAATIAIALACVGGSIGFALGPHRSKLRILAVGSSLGVALVVVAAALPGAADADANLRAIEGIWEPGEDGEAPPSRVLKALAEGP